MAIIKLHRDGRREDITGQWTGELPNQDPLAAMSKDEIAYMDFVGAQAAIPKGYLEIVRVLYEGDRAQLIVHESGKLIGQLLNLQASLIYYEASRGHSLAAAVPLDLVADVQKAMTEGKKMCDVPGLKDRLDASDGFKSFMGFIGQTSGGIVGDVVLLLTGEHKLT